MRLFLIILLLVFLMLIFFQDIKLRKIHALLPLAIFGISIYLTLLVFKTTYHIVLFNAGLFVITFIIMVGYMKIKRKINENPFMSYFGMGDFLYFLSISPLFSSISYLLYFIFSLLFSLLIFIFFIQKNGKETIPLAGLSSLLLGLIILYDLFFDLKKMTLLLI